MSLTSLSSSQKATRPHLMVPTFFLRAARAAMRALDFGSEYARCRYISRKVSGPTRCPGSSTELRCRWRLFVSRALIGVWPALAPPSKEAGESMVLPLGLRRCCMEVASDLDRGRMVSNNCFILLADPPADGRAVVGLFVREPFLTVSGEPPMSVDFFRRKRFRKPPELDRVRKSPSIWSLGDFEGGWWWTSEDASESSRGIAKALRSWQRSKKKGKMHHNAPGWNHNACKEPTWLLALHMIKATHAPGSSDLNA